MPTTSTFVPLIGMIQINIVDIILGWFYLCMILLISSGTLASSVVIEAQKKGRMGERLSPSIAHILRFFSMLTMTEIPPHLNKSRINATEVFV
jgi:hypothetical protein